MRATWDMKSRLFGQNQKDLCRLAFRLTEPNKIKNNLNESLKTAGEVLQVIQNAIKDYF